MRTVDDLAKHVTEGVINTLSKGGDNLALYQTIRERLGGQVRPTCPFKDPTYDCGLDVPCPVCGGYGFAHSEDKCIG